MTLNDTEWLIELLANPNSRSLYAVAHPSVVCLAVCLPVIGNARAPYSGGSHFQQYLYSVWYPSHPLTSTENFTEIVPGNPSAGGVKHKRVINHCVNQCIVSAVHGTNLTSE